MQEFSTPFPPRHSRISVFLESVKINGINGKIQCTVDKATGNITKIVFTNTDVLNLGVKVAGSNLDVKFALACENSYSIKY